MSRPPIVVVHATGTGPRCRKREIARGVLGTSSASTSGGAAIVGGSFSLRVNHEDGSTTHLEFSGAALDQLLADIAQSKIAQRVIEASRPVIVL